MTDRANPEATAVIGRSGAADCGIFERCTSTLPV